MAAEAMEKPLIRAFSSITLFVMWLCIASTSLAQSIHSLKFKNYNSDQGLSQSTVNDIIHDTDGYVWIATQEGLNRFDGYSFKIFKHNPVDSTTIGYNYVDCIYQDRQSRIWVGTLGGGLSLYNSQTERFIRFQRNTSSPHSLSNNFVHAIYQDSRNRLWIGTDLGLNLLRDDGKSFVHFTHEPDNTHSLSDNRIRAIYEDKAGRIWIGTLGGLNLLHENDTSFTRFVNDPKASQSLYANTVVDMIEDSHHNFWVATQSGGLNLLDRSTGRFEYFTSINEDPSSISSNDISAIAEVQNGKLWVGTKRGLSILDIETKKFTRNLHIPNDSHTISHNDVRKIMRDRSGNIWVGTFDGVNFFDSRGDVFSYYSHNERDPESLSDNAVWAICQDKQKRIWVGTHYGLNLLEPGKSTFVRFFCVPGDENSLSHNLVTSVYQDNQNRIWITTFNGLNLYDEKKKTFTHFFYTPRSSTSTSRNSFLAVFQDNENKMWIGTRENGLYCSDATGEKFTQYVYNEKDPESISNNRIHHIFQDKQNRLWVGTNDGLCLYNPLTKKFRRYLHDNSNIHSISNNDITQIFQDRLGNLWVGTAGGLNLFNPDSGTFTSWDESKGLSNNNICGILEDDRGNLWLSTSKGISKFNIEIKRFTWYDKGDGLQSTEYYNLSVMKDHNGFMYFGGPNGLSIFHPDSIKDNTEIPPVVITDFQLFNKSVSISDTTVLKNSLTYTQNITLTHQQNQFAIEFSALNYRQQEKNQFAYKLEPFNKDWIYTDYKDRKAVFTNIPPGEYVFRVKASNDYGYWNEEGASIKVIILPPWWLTWWAKTLWGGLIFGSILTIYKLRTNSLKAQKRKLELQVKERTQELKNTNEELHSTVVELHSFHAEIRMKNIHLTDLNREKDGMMNVVAHDLKSPLNNIEGLINLLPLDGSLTHEQQQHIDRIKNQIYTGKNLINDLLDIHAYGHEEAQLNFSELSLNQFVSDLLGSYKALLEKKGQRIIAEFKSGETTLSTDKNILRRIVDNLLTNAMKFSGNGTTVTLTCWREGGLVKISIADQGPGISEEDQKKMFKMFQKLSARPTGGESSNGLGLSIIKTLTEKLKGTIEVNSKLGVGSEFIISLPTKA